MASLTRAAHLASVGGVGCVALGRRAPRPRGRARHAHWRPLPARLCAWAWARALALTLTLTLGACSGTIARPGPTPTPVPTPAVRQPLDCSSGRGMWLPTFELAVSPPVTADGVVYVAYTLPDATHNPSQETYAVAALRAHDGTLLWRVPTARWISPFAVADGVLVVSSSPYAGDVGNLVGLRASDGATLWRSSLAAEPTAFNHGVLYLTNISTVFALRFVDGRTLWQTPERFSVGTVADGTSVYMGVGDGSVVALRADTGAIRWTAFTRAAASPLVVHFPLATSGGQLYVTASDTEGVQPALQRLNAVDGTYDGEALVLPTYTELFYSLLTGDIFTTVFFRSTPPGRADAPAPTLNGYRLSATGYGRLLWSVPGQAADGQETAHDAQTFYFEAFSPLAVIFAYRLTDGAVRWRQPALARGGTPIAAGAGYLFETRSGTDDPCHNPPFYEVTPQIRALTATQGAVAWTRALDSTL